jgi:hypothetical protein
MILADERDTVAECDIFRLQPKSYRANLPKRFRVRNSVVTADDTHCDLVGVGIARRNYAFTKGQ